MADLAEPQDQVCVSRADYVRLVNRSKTLARLEAAGVDNWEGYSYAFDEDDEEDDE